MHFIYYTLFWPYSFYYIPVKCFRTNYFQMSQLYPIRLVVHVLLFLTPTKEVLGVAPSRRVLHHIHYDLVAYLYVLLLSIVYLSKVCKLNSLWTEFLMFILLFPISVLLVWWYQRLDFQNLFSTEKLNICEWPLFKIKKLMTALVKYKFSRL